MLVTNKLPGIIRLLRGKVELKPGDNQVDDDLWNQAKVSQHAQQLIAQKRLLVAVGGKAATPLPTKPSTPPADAATEDTTEEVRVEEAPLTKGMTAKDAIELVKASDDEDWLEACLEDETRSTVIDALESRIDDLQVD